MNILVTGGAGFIGSHLVDAFVGEGHRVSVIDDLSSGTRENIPEGVQLFELDIRDAGVARVFEATRPDVLCHHAAQMDVRRSVADPIFDADVNVLGSLRLLELCRKHGTGRVLFASTGGAMYGDGSPLPAPETLLPEPVSPYGVSKLAVERYLHFYAVEHGMRTTSLRYANVYGPRQNPHGEAGVVAIFAHRLIAGEAPTIYGSGEQTRDFVYVGDVVQANLLALRHDLVGAYNVGTATESSVNQLYGAMCEVLGASLEARYAPGRPGEQQRSCLDASRLQAAVGWRPATSLREGLAPTCEFFRSRARAGS